MNTHPNAGTADILTDLHARAKAVDIEDGGLADALRMLSRDYRDWLTGEWTAEPGRADEVIGERAFLAKHRARDLGFSDIAAALIALEL